METINKVSKINDNEGIIREIIEFNGKKFKIIASLRNGRNELEVQIMDSDGVFQLVLGKFDVNFEYTANYVSDKNRKEADLLKGINAIKSVIKKVYS